MNYAVLLSGGVGSRVGEDRPKQYIEISGMPVFMFALESILPLEIIDKIIICLSDEWKEYVKSFTNPLNDKRILFSNAGASREESVFNSLNTIKDTLNPTDNDVVVITESARPLASSALIKSVTLSVNGYDGALPIIPIKDTVYESPDKININSVPERDFLFIGQSPEAFVFHRFYDIHLGMTSEALANCHGSTQLAFDNGFKIHLIPGEESNRKITTAVDLEYFKFIVQNRQLIK